MSRARMPSWKPTVAALGHPVLPVHVRRGGGGGAEEAVVALKVEGSKGDGSRMYVRPVVET